MMTIINKTIKLTEIMSCFYLVIFFYFFTLNKCYAAITTNDACHIIKKSDEQANLEYLALYKKLILATLEKLFDQHTERFLSQKYKTESQKIRTSINESCTIPCYIGNIPIDRKTL